MGDGLMDDLGGMGCTMFYRVFDYWTIFFKPWFWTGLVSERAEIPCPNSCLK